MTTLGPRRIALDGPANFRDLGGYPTVDGRTVRSGRVFRSDSLSHLSDADVARLVDGLGLVTVVDLRAANEVATYGPAPLAGRGVAVHHLPIVDETRRRPGDGEPDPVSRPMAELYGMMLERFADRFVGVLRVVADPVNQPVVFHCAAGKDRTGLVAALLLGVLGVDDDVIALDYATTAEHLDELLARQRSRGAAGNEAGNVDPALLTAEAHVMRDVLAGITTAHGSVTAYVTRHGLDARELASLRARLLA
ncbi:MAG TPA: tyrosine-protein phosphatase [Acidimicrobiia bacterium]|nr:tyrosine-protein phosphatase [Acidimicrobiia bacterium]